MHPECIGRGHRMAILERFIAEAKALDGVVFARLDAHLEGWGRAEIAASAAWPAASST